MSLLRGLLFDNLGLKLVALLLALMVYLHVFTDRSATMVVSFPVQVADLPDSLSLAGPVPAGVQAELQGTGKQFIRLWLTEPRLKVSLAGVGPGRVRRRLTRDDLPLIESDRLNVQRLIGPDTLDLLVDRKVARTLPVAPRVEVAPQRDLEWTGEIRVSPPTATVRGPRRAVVGLDSVRLSPVRVAHARDSLALSVAPSGLPEWCVSDPATFTVATPLVRRAPAHR